MCQTACVCVFISAEPRLLRVYAFSDLGSGNLGQIGWVLGKGHPQVTHPFGAFSKASGTEAFPAEGRPLPSNYPGGQGLHTLGN